jgi:pimeloyl-ACP methyl ester carboxylesterase
MGASPQGVIGSLKGMAERPDAFDLVRRLDVPALVLAGEADGVIPAAKNKEAADAFKQATYVSIPGGGHMLMMEYPERIADAFIKFMRQFEKN